MDGCGRPDAGRDDGARAAPIGAVDRFADVLCHQWDDADDGGGDAERDRVRTIVDRESDRGATVTRRRRRKEEDCETRMNE